MYHADAETKGEQVKQLVQLFTENAIALTPPDFKLMLLIISLNCLAPEVDENRARHCSQFFTSFKHTKKKL